MSRLPNKIAIITGASNGIGAATARRFVAEGAKVFLIGRNEQALFQIRDELTPDNCDVMVGDVSTETKPAHFSRSKIL